MLSKSILCRIQCQLHAVHTYDCSVCSLCVCFHSVYLYGGTYAYTIPLCVQFVRERRVVLLMCTLEMSNNGQYTESERGKKWTHRKRYQSNQSLALRNMNHMFQILSTARKESSEYFVYMRCSEARATHEIWIAARVDASISWLLFTNCLACGIALPAIVHMCSIILLWICGDDIGEVGHISKMESLRVSNLWRKTDLFDLHFDTGIFILSH